MADVQLEHGHVRVANRLVEAILAAAFKGTHVRILLALVRLTYGWKRRTVRVHLVELAKSAGVEYTGGFRRVLDDLVANGVVIVVERARGTEPATFAMQKDYEAWGTYSIASGALAARWQDRPDHRDTMLDASAPTGADGMTLPPQGHGPTGADGAPPQGQTVRPHRGRVTEDSPPFHNDLQARKERKETKEILPPSITEAEATLALRLATDGDRLALTAIVRGVPVPGPWIAEVGAHLDGLHLPQLTAVQAGEALRDFVGNGGLTDPQLAHFRGYLKRAGARREPRPPSAGRGRRGTSTPRPTPQTYDYTTTKTPTNGDDGWPE